MPFLEPPLYVLDGGDLLYKVEWQTGSTFSKIFEDYHKYIIKNYGENVSVIFDGGYGTSSTKDTTHLRRRGASVCLEIQFQPQAKLTKKRRGTQNLSR